MIEFQRLLLGDQVRNDAFARALKAVIIPGKTTMADIGSGTGYLSFLAEKLGAKECFLYEVSNLLDLSKTIAKENGMEHCRFFKTHSTVVKHPPQVDVIVSETLGNWPYEENIIETMNDAQRFLKPGGIIIPQCLRSFVAPVTSSRLYDELNVWDRVGSTLDFSAAKEICMNNMYVKDMRKDDLLPSPIAMGEGRGGEGRKEGQLWDVIDFQMENSSIREGTLEWRMDSPVTLYGFAVWWEATLVNDIMLSTNPHEPSTHWKQIYLPLLDLLPVKKGQTVRLSLKSDSHYDVKINVEWETTIVDQRGKAIQKLKQDMRKGSLS